MKNTKSKVEILLFLVLLLALQACNQKLPADPLKDPSNLSFWIFWDCVSKGDCKFDPSHPTERYFVFANAATGSDSAAGTRADPLQTIAAAISKASATGKAAVAACAGTYSENALVLSQPVSLYGSYDCTSWSRTSTYGYSSFDGVNATILQAGGYSASNTATLTVTGSGISRSVVLDGFDIQGAASGAEGSIGLKITGSASPTVSNNKINGGGGTASASNPNASVGLWTDSGSADITANDINGGSGTSAQASQWACIGLNVTSSAAPYIHANTVNGGNCTSNVAGSGQPLGSIAVNWSANSGANTNQKNPIENNTIHGGTATLAANSYTGGCELIRALSISATSQEFVIQGNQIDAGFGTSANNCKSETRAIVVAASKALIQKNRIYGGEMSVSTNPSWLPMVSITIGNTAGSYYIINNYIYGSDYDFSMTGNKLTEAISLGSKASMYVYYNTIYTGTCNGSSFWASIFHYNAATVRNRPFRPS